MKTSALFAFTLPLAFSIPALAEILRVDDGGQEIYVNDHIPEGEAGIIFFYASWDVPSKEMADEVENWASSYTGLNIVLVDISDTRSQVCRQFGIETIPSIIVLNVDHEKTGDTVDNVVDLEEILADEGII